MPHQTIIFFYIVRDVFLSGFDRGQASRENASELGKLLMAYIRQAQVRAPQLVFSTDIAVSNALCLMNGLGEHRLVMSDTAALAPSVEYTEDDSVRDKWVANVSDAIMKMNAPSPSAAPSVLVSGRFRLIQRMMEELSGETITACSGLSHPPGHGWIIQATATHKPKLRIATTLTDLYDLSRPSRQVDLRMTKKR